MHPKIHVVPRTGLKVRTRNGECHIRAEGEAVGPDTYYRRRIAAGDLVVMTDAATADEAKVVPTLKDVLGALEKGNPAHWTEAGKPDLNHLSDVLNRRVSRREVDSLLKEMEA